MEEEEMDINLSLKFSELQVIFKALGQQPFQEVYEIIGKINQQVNLQIDSSKPQETKD